MYQDELAGIFALVPTEVREEALINILELIFARGEWQLVKDALDRLQLLQPSKKICGRAMVLGIKAALRLREPDAALEQYLLLRELGSGRQARALQAEALYFIACHLLPSRPESLAALWEACSSSEMQGEAGQLWARTGSLLEQVFAKNCEQDKASRIRELLAAYPNANASGAQ